MTDLTKIVNTTLEIYSFTDEQVDLFKTVLQTRTLIKKENLIRPGRVCNFLTYVNSGSLREYLISEGKEQTLHFFTEGMWAADAESFFAQKPSQLYIEATEETEVILLSIIDFHALINKYPVFSILGRIMNNWSISTSRFTSLSSMNPDERYQELLRDHPEWVNRFPQIQIASWLGITPETLSRVRARMKRKTSVHS